MKMRPSFIQLFVVSVVLVAVQCQWRVKAIARQNAGPENERQVSELLGNLISGSPEKYDSLINEIVQESNSVRQLAAGIASSKPNGNDARRSKLEAGWTQWEATDAAGVSRPYQVYLPKSVAEGTSPVAVIVHLHGAVSRPEFGTGLGSPQAVGYGSMLWSGVADAENFVIVCPQGKTECAWWTDNGVSHIQAVLRDVRRMINVPDQSIFASGFSDGASGCYYLATVAPDPFAGFIAMNGHPAVASGASDKQIYLRNMINTPMIAAMTQEDSLYPSRSVLPHITAAIQYGANIHVISYPNINHQPLYFNDQTTTIVNFIKNTKRLSEQRVQWLTAEDQAGTVQWLEIMETGSGSGDGAELPDVNMMTTPGRVRMGVQLSPPQAGEPVRIVEVVDGSAASASGIQGGDVVVRFDGQAVGDVGQFRRLLRSKRFGDAFTTAVKRGDKVLELSGSFPEFRPRPVYRRDQPTCYVDVLFNEDSMAVASRGIRKMKVWLPLDWSDRDEITVERNGTTSQVKVQRLDAREFLARFAQSGDRTAARFAYVVIE